MFSKAIVAEPSKQTKFSENGYSDASTSNKYTNYLTYILMYKSKNFKDFGSKVSRVAPNLTSSNSAEAEFGRISELKFGRSRSRIWLKLVFWSH